MSTPPAPAPAPAPALPLCCPPSSPLSLDATPRFRVAVTSSASSANCSPVVVPSPLVVRDMAAAEAASSSVSSSLTDLPALGASGRPPGAPEGLALTWAALAPDGAGEPATLRRGPPTTPVEGLSVTSAESRFAVHAAGDLSWSPAETATATSTPSPGWNPLAPRALPLVTESDPLMMDGRLEASDCRRAMPPAAARRWALIVSMRGARVVANIDRVTSAELTAVDAARVSARPRPRPAA
mmetsp:Transcript_19546/g.74967  ORF Transcript_19546/g.74967 Transcript_19546/m.74967 type:complete len:240 (-) Transcript_19546:292-1011(-)